MAKLKDLLWYAANGYWIFPCKPGGKTPLTEHGFKDATNDPATITAWHEQYSACNWGMACGASGRDVIDIDPRHGGTESWEALRNEHPDPLETVTVKTGGGGQHLWFLADPKHPLSCGANVLGPGIDIRAEGGYVVVPPSVTDAPYTFIHSPIDTPTEPMPAWMLARLNGRPAALEPEQPDDKHDALVAKAFKALSMLKRERADDYEQWTQVGMTLRELGRLGLMYWDSWSGKSDKYKPGECAHKWETFTAGEQGDLTLATLFKWAEEDSGRQVVPSCPDHPRPSHYMAALQSMDYTFSLNSMNDEIHVNGSRQDDIIRAVLFTGLREHGYNNPRVAEDAWTAEAASHRFHPIRDYLNSLTWDGQDNIGKLCGYVDEGKNDTFGIFFRRFLVGAVARPMAGPAGVQARAFVIDGPQGIGKSRFVRFLGSPLPAFYMESGINTEDKDFLLYLCGTWIWEVAELGSTLRRADREALKHFISRQTVTVRRPYGRNDTRKPAIAAMVPTINNEAGFLWDPTGYRRYMVATIERINWAYEQEVDINQVWAHAVHLYRVGEPWELLPDESAYAETLSQEYEVSDPLVDYILAEYEIEKQKAFPVFPEWFTPTAQILSRLKGQNYIRDTSTKEAMHVGGILLKMGCRRGRQRQGGQFIHGYHGVKIRV